MKGVTNLSLFFKEMLQIQADIAGVDVICPQFNEVRYNSYLSHRIIDSFPQIS